MDKHNSIQHDFHEYVLRYKCIYIKWAIISNYQQFRLNKINEI